jgi:hypothetical protein
MTKGISVPLSSKLAGISKADLKSFKVWYKAVAENVPSH